MAIFRDTTDKNHSDRSSGDRLRHGQKVRKAIKDNIGDILSDESIVGKDRDKIIKVPIRGIKEYRFVHGDNTGTGQGDGGQKPGDIIGQSEDGKKGKQQAGDRPGVDYYEHDITLGELIDMMFEDLNLPELKQRDLRNIEVQTKVRKKGLRHKGTRKNLLALATQREHIRAEQGNQRMLDEIRNRIEVLRAAGNIDEAEQLAEKLKDHEQQLLDLRKKLKVKKKDNWIAIRPENRRYAKSKIEPKKHSNAVVVCIMDTSGSMDTEKKYLAKSFFFFLVRFVQIRYQNIEIVFVAHTTNAQEVTEEEFFTKGESGGTFISSGYEKALEIIKERYDPSLWNAYAFHCSDGDNFEEDNDKAVKTARELCKATSLFGYGEIKPLGAGYYGSSMLQLFKDSIKEPNFQTVLIRNKDEVYPRFAEFFAKDKSEGERK
ncbi:MAG: DUF444 family protein [bacterium]|nr:DUF444 family protein [bacterium]